MPDRRGTGFIYRVGDVIVVGAFVAFGMVWPLVYWKVVPVAAPLLHGPTIPPAVVMAEAATYIVPLSLLMRTRGPRWCLAVVGALVVGRALLCLPFANYSPFVWPPFSWGWLPAGGVLLRFRCFWTDYLAIPLAQVTWIGMLVSYAVWRSPDDLAGAKLRRLRLAAPLLLGAGWAIVLSLGWRDEVRGYPERAKVERDAAGNLRYVRAAVAKFHETHGAYPATLEDQLRPQEDPPEVGLDVAGRHVAIDPAKYTGPDSRPEAFEDTLAGDGGLWSYSTEPPRVGAVSTRGEGYTLAYGIPYSRL